MLESSLNQKRNYYEPRKIENFAKYEFNGDIYKKYYQWGDI